MFDQLARAIPGGPDRLFEKHPQVLSRWLEEAWSAVRLPPTFLGLATPGTLADILGTPGTTAAIGLPPPLPPSGLGFPVPLPPSGSGLAAVVPPAFIWNNLLYAYLIESTGVAEVMAEVIRRNLVGETLDPSSLAFQQWARSTEDLFFSDPPPFHAVTAGSHVRLYTREARRNAYWRLFGFDLPHLVPARWADSRGQQPWKVDVGAGLNSGFRAQWTEFLRQVWLGLENRRNLVGANSADPEYVATLCRSLGDMLRMRRRGGQLAREEAAYVAMMSWFDVTLSTNTGAVAALSATAASPEGRLASIGQLVGISPAPRSRELFQLAQPAATIVRMIELHFFDSGAMAGALFAPGPMTPLMTQITLVIDLWQSATGDRIKDRPVGTGPGTGLSAQPLRTPTPAPTGALAAAQPSGNGARTE